jgi:hypothetical protein
MSAFPATTQYDSSQPWLPGSPRAKPWPPTATGSEAFNPEYPQAAVELLADPWWTRKIDRGILDSLNGRTRSLQEHLDAH